MPVDFRTDKRYCHLTAEQVLKHFEIERSLANEIKRSPRSKRAATMLWAYDELFRQVPWHPALTETSGSDAPDIIENKVRRFLSLLPAPPAKILEIGCGMGELTLGLIQAGFDAFGMDISDLRRERLSKAATGKFARADAVYLPWADASFDVVISQQLFEHLHPDDAKIHLGETYRIIKDGGCYILETPNKLIGPGDVSRFFVDGPAQGFHLREYSISDMVRLFHNQGYRSVTAVLRRIRRCSERSTTRLEKVWSMLPKSLRTRHTMGLHNPIYLAEK
jgi:SAM-dependent methyltransferase